MLVVYNICLTIRQTRHVSGLNNIAACVRNNNATFVYIQWIYNAERDFDNLVERCKDFQLQGDNARSFYKYVSTYTSDMSLYFYFLVSFRLISDNVSDIYAEAWKNYIAYATASGTSTTVLMMILSQGKAGG